MRYVSVVGDSISTFEGYNPPGYSVFYDQSMQIRNGLSSVYDTWWAKVNQAIHAYLCVNNSYSGSRVTGRGFPAASCRERLIHLRTAGIVPDIILIYIGINDFGQGIIVRQKKFFTGKNPEVFEDAYNMMLRTLRYYYPKTAVVCGTLMRSTVENREDWVFPEKLCGMELEDYNDAIRICAGKNGCYLADVSASGGRYETYDGTHPTVRGHQTIARAWIECLAGLG